MAITTSSSTNVKPRRCGQLARLLRAERAMHMDVTNLVKFTLKDDADEKLRVDSPAI
jgi:hypothetical protein